MTETYLFSVNNTSITWTSPHGPCSFNWLCLSMVWTCWIGTVLLIVSEWFLAFHSEFF